MSKTVFASVKNTEDRPVVVHSVEGPRVIQPGETSPEYEFTEGEHAQNERLYKVKAKGAKASKADDDKDEGDAPAPDFKLPGA